MKDATLTNAPLGKKTSYRETYDPSLLYSIPRSSGRENLQLSSPLPFGGGDIWTGYELSWLTPKGKPEIAIGEFFFPCSSKYLIESKSFKLYLNSFNQTSFSSLEEVQKTLEKDLTVAAEERVSVILIPPSKFLTLKIEGFPGTCLDTLDVSTDNYQPSPEFLKISSKEVEETLHSHLLKSNCPVTGQPDWASVLIHYKGLQINHEGLLKYLISFRNHSEFHEQCIERMFLDILNHCCPTQLTVYARYTRRGGLDINPFRSNFEGCPQNPRLPRQ